jgi:DNA-binding response OmpR family regulator
VRILVVDDYDDSRNLIEAALQSAGYGDVVAVDSAAKALDVLDFWRPDADVTVDVLLLDIVMPKTDGIETRALIRKEARYDDLPIIMLSSLEDNDALVDCFAAGATDYIVKPFNPTELSRRVQNAIRSKDFAFHRATECGCRPGAPDAASGAPSSRCSDHCFWILAARTKLSHSLICLRSRTCPSSGVLMKGSPP